MYLDFQIQFLYLNCMNHDIKFLLYANIFNKFSDPLFVPPTKRGKYSSNMSALNCIKLSDFSINVCGQLSHSSLGKFKNSFKCDCRLLTQTITQFNPSFYLIYSFLQSLLIAIHSISFYFPSQSVFIFFFILVPKNLKPWRYQ